jgi:predicted molibdopterin-dependent oxidoreductase YjgC
MVIRSQTSAYDSPANSHLAVINGAAARRSSFQNTNKADISINVPATFHTTIPVTTSSIHRGSI